MVEVEVEMVEVDVEMEAIANKIKIDKSGIFDEKINQLMHDFGVKIQINLTDVYRSRV